MAPLLDIPGRATKAADEEVAEPRLGTGEIVAGVHRSQDVVAGYLSIEGAYETREAVLANELEEIVFVQGFRFYWEDVRRGTP